MIPPEFLDLDEILEIHALQLDEFGGTAGVRDRGLLESAVEQPRATAFGELLHIDLFEMAAAYLFHIVKNHAFLDGNKRTALVAALVFLDINGVSLEREDERLYELTMAAAEGRSEGADRRSAPKAGERNRGLAVRQHPKWRRGNATPTQSATGSSTTRTCSSSAGIDSTETTRGSLCFNGCVSRRAPCHQEVPRRSRHRPQLELTGVLRRG